MSEEVATAAVDAVAGAATGCENVRSSGMSGIRPVRCVYLEVFFHVQEMPGWEQIYIAHNRWVFFVDLYLLILGKNKGGNCVRGTAVGKRCQWFFSFADGDIVYRAVFLQYFSWKSGGMYTSDYDPDVLVDLFGYFAGVDSVL